MANRWENSGNSVRLYFWVLQNHWRWWLQPWKAFLGRKVKTNLDSILKSRDITLPTKVHLVKAMVFPVVMYGCENWTIKKAEHWRIDALNVPLEKALESPLDCVEMKSVNTEGNKPWIFIWGTCTQAEAPILWPPDVKIHLIRKEPDAGIDWRREEKRLTED